MTISNEGNAELKVTDITINGKNANSFAVLSNNSFTLSSGNESDISVACTPTVVGELTATLKVISNDAGSPHSYLLSCVGSSEPEPIFASEPQAGASISLGDVAVGTTSPSKPITISNDGNGDLRIDNIRIEDSSEFSVSPKTDFTISGNSLDTRVLQVNCTPTSEGKFTDKLVLNADGVDKTYSLSCDGTQPVFESNYVDGETIDLGETITDGNVTKDIIVMNAGNADLVVKQVTIKGEHANVFSVPTEPFTVSTEPLAKQTVTVTCTPPAKGEFTASLELMTNDPSNERPSYELSCVGQQVCPSINFEPDNRDDSIIASLGFGYDKSRDLHKPQSCFNGNVTQVGGKTENITLALISDYKQFDRDLNFSASLNVNAKAFKINAKTEFAMNHQDTKLSKSMYLKSEVFFHQPFNQQGLNEFGQEMLNNGEQCFISACGDSFIYQADVGSKLIVAMKFNFNNEESKKSFFAELGASYNAVDIKAAIKTSKESVINGSSITVEVQQFGSNTNPANVFGTGSPIVYCPFNTIKESADGKSCIEKAMDNVIAYARDEFATSVSSNPEVFNFQTVNYVNAGVPIVLENVPMDIISAREELAAKYQEQWRDLMLAEDWLSGKFKGDFEHTEIKYLMGIKAAIQTNLALIRDAGLWCFSDFTQCLDKQEKAYDSLKTYDQKWLYGIKVVEKTNILEKPVSKSNVLSFDKEKKWQDRPSSKSGEITACVPEECKANNGKVIGGILEGILESEKVSRRDSRCFILSATIIPKAKKFAKTKARYRGTLVVDGICTESTLYYELIVPEM